MIKLSNFRTQYEPLTEYICIKEKIDGLEKKINESKDISNFNNKLVKEINELIEKIKNVKIEEKGMIRSEKDRSLRYSLNCEKTTRNPILETSNLSKKYS